MTPQSFCPLCSGRDASLVGKKDRHGNPLTSVLCNLCGLIYVDPLPTRAEIDRYYADSYRVDYKGTFEPKPKHVLRAGRVAIGRLRRLKPLLATRPHVVDVGAGGGELVYMLTHLGGVRAEGLEPNIGYAEHASRALQVDVRHGYVERAEIDSGSMDMVTMFHVLEHLSEPRVAVRRIAEWLRPGGVLVIEVPNAEATCQAPNHTFHAAHLTIFGVPTLERLGVECGLRPISSRWSTDGGNIEMIILRDASLDGEGKSREDLTQGYAHWLAARLQQHVLMKHFFSMTPYHRLVKRIARQIEERNSLRGLRHPREILDSLIHDERQRGWPANHAWARHVEA